jgi:hypothetical protein
MADPAYKTLDDLDDDVREAAAHLDHVPGSSRRVTFADLVRSLEQHGPDPTLLDTALLLTENDYHAFVERFNRAKRTDSFPRRLKIRRRR